MAISLAAQPSRRAVAAVAAGSWAWAAVPAFWLLAAIPSVAVGWVVAGMAAVLPSLVPRLAPLLLLTSCFFYSTMAIPSSLLYALRAYWVAAYLTWMLVLVDRPVPVRIWRWVLIVGALLVWGTTIMAMRHGGATDPERPLALEAGIAYLWVTTLLVGWLWLQSQDGQLSRTDVVAITGAWLVSIAYGVLQAVLGVNELTVPPDIWPKIEGFRQYEDLGRRPFASLTANGMAAVSLLPVAILLCRARSSMFGTLATVLLALTVGILSLTRSYLALLVALCAVLPWICGTRAAIWFVLVIVGAGVAAYLLAQIDPEFLSLALRLEGDVTSLRADLWSFTLNHLDASAVIVGMGYGPGVWEGFLSPLSDQKVLASPHSALLETTGTFGVAGLGVYVAIGVTLLRSFLRHRKSRSDAAALALAGLLILLREQVAASYVFSASVLGAYFWLVFGMAMGARDGIAAHTSAAGKSS